MQKHNTMKFKPISFCGEKPSEHEIIDKRMLLCVYFWSVSLNTAHLFWFISFFSSYNLFRFVICSFTIDVNTKIIIRPRRALVVTITYSMISFHFMHVVFKQNIILSRSYHNRRAFVCCFQIFRKRKLS